MAEIIETTGKSVEDALSLALDKLGCGRAEVTYEIVQEPSGGFLGLWGKREARIRVTTRPVIRPQHTEIPIPAQPTVLAAPPASPSPSKEQRAEDDGFGARPKRFHTDLRSSARRSEQSGPRALRSAEEHRAAGPRSGSAESRPPRSRGYEREEQDSDRRAQRERSAYEADTAYDGRSRRDRTDSHLIPLTEEMAAAADKFLGEIFAAMHLDVQLHRTDTPAGTIFNMQGDSLGILIGKHGATLDALQYLTNLVVNKRAESGFYARVILDVEDYRARREETLTRLAGHLADKACRIGEEIHLEPMSRHERKIIHMALQDNRRVTTYSAGDNPRRYVVIVPRRRRYARDYEESGYDRYER